MIPVVTPDEMGAIDAAADVPLQVLVERAGAAVARSAVSMLGGVYGRIVVVVAGPGNNGADGRVAASILASLGVKVEIYDALDMPAELPPADLVIDAAFGTGFRGDWVPPVIHNAAVLAVDVPTGLDGFSGIAAAHTIVADRTVTFSAAKPGHFMGAGKQYTGMLEIADIGLNVDSATIAVVERGDVATWLPGRSVDDHKWSHAVRVVAGSEGMTGAAHLASAAAMRSGSGMVTLSTPGLCADTPVEVVDRLVPATDWADDVLSDLHRYKSLVIGPGLGRDDHTAASTVRVVLESVVPVVVDGDGLFAMSWNESGSTEFLRGRVGETILTPHDGEFGRLTGSRPGDDRIGAARSLAAVCGATVLLKGPTTVVAEPGGRTLLVSNGDQRMATAGTGDVLAGIIGAMLAIGVPPTEAAAGGAWIHCEAARRCGRVTMVASDLLHSLPKVLEEC